MVLFIFLPGMSESDKHVENTQFPNDLRVLAIDDNLVCLRWLEALLKKCRYDVTATTNSLEALEMLRQNKDNFDIVITDVRRFDDMDGFSLLDIIGLEMDLPVIMISADDDTSTVMKGIRHGARDYLLKPVRMEVIKNIWQHVVRKSLSDPNKSCITKGVTDQDPACLKRHRDSSKEKQDETNTQSDGDSGPQKKKRVTWTPELHNKFVDAIEQLGENAVPKQILQIMNEPGINRENVASHLQKFRKMLKKSCKMSEESNNDIYPNNKGGHISNTPILLSGSRSGVHGNSNAEMTQLGNGILKSDPFGSSHMDLKRLFQLPNQQNPLLQQYPATLQLVDKTQPRMHIPVHGNALQTPLWIESHLPVPEFNGLKFSTFSSEPMVHNGLMEVSSCFPSFSTGSEPGPSSTPLVVHRPNSYSSATTFFDLPYPMLGDASNVTTSTATTPNPQQNPVVMPVQNFFMGQHEGRSYVDLNGRSQINGFSFGIQGPIIQDSNGNDQINSLHPSQENLQTVGSFHHIKRSDSEDDLSVMVKQFGDDGAPTL